MPQWNTYVGTYCQQISLHVQDKVLVAGGVLHWLNTKLRCRRQGRGKYVMGKVLYEYDTPSPSEVTNRKTEYVQVILFEIDCAIFYTNLPELFCQLVSWKNWVNSGKFMDNCWISCQVMADVEKIYYDLIIINLH